MLNILRWGRLIRAAKKRWFPDDLLAFLYRIHSALRHVLVEGAVVDKVDPSISVVAGCACADLMMFLQMLDVDEDVNHEEPDVITAVVADDFQILAVDDVEGLGVQAKSAQKKMVNAVSATLKSFMKAKLPVAKDKLAALASTRQLEKDLARQIPVLAKSLCKHTRSLGVDFTLRKSRCTPTFSARFKRTRKRAQRLKRAKEMQVDCSKVVASLVNAGTCWGASLTGASRPQVKSRRTLAHVITTKQPCGRNVTVDLALAKIAPFTADPIYRLRIDPVHTLAKAVWDEWVPPQWIVVDWDKTFQNVTNGQTTWRNATSPLAVAALSMQSFGWTSPRPWILMTANGRGLDLREVCPATVRHLARADMDLQLRRELADRDPSLRRSRQIKFLGWFPCVNWSRAARAPIGQDDIRPCLLPGLQMDYMPLPA